MSAGLNANANQPGGNDLCVIEYNDVRRGKQVDKIADLTMFNRPGLTVYDHHLRRIAVSQRLLSNQLFRQVVVIITDVV